MIHKTTQEVYLSLFNQLENNDIEKAIKIALGDQAPNREFLIEKTHNTLIQVYVGFRKNENKDVLWVDKLCPFFTISPMLTISFHKGVFGSEFDLGKVMEIDNFEKNIDFFGAYRFFSKLLTKSEVIA